MIKNSNGIKKYGFYHYLKKKHKLLGFLTPTCDWSHGWDFFHSKILSTYRCSINENLNFVVPTLKEKINLEKFTKNKIYLDCLPFYYFLKKQFPEPKNIKYYKNNENNLIVFPGKMSFDNYSQNEIEQRKNYFDFIFSQRKNFEKIIVCIPLKDSFYKEYLELIKTFDFDYVTGADPNDLNSYYRILQILSIGKNVTTNCLGSILVYAAVLNKKISLSGPIYEPLRELKNLYLPKNFSYKIDQVREEYLRIQSADFIKKNYNFLIFEDLKSSKEQLNWGLNEIGSKNFVSSTKAVEYLGYNLKDQIKFYQRKIKKFF